MAEESVSDKFKEVMSFAQQNGVSGYRAAPRRSATDTSAMPGARSAPGLDQRRRSWSWWRGFSTPEPKKPQRRITRAVSEHAISELRKNIQRSPRWQKAGAKPSEAARAMRYEGAPSAPCPDWRGLPSALGGGALPKSGARQLVVFLDYDGTLTPIVNDPAAATLSEAMRAAVRALASRATVAVVSGRAREKLRDFVRIPELYYAGSHGFDIDGPGGLRHSVSAEIIPVLAAARDLLMQRLEAIPGSSVEDNRFSVSVHWRNCAERRAEVEAVVDGLMAEAPFAGALRKQQGKCVYELRPDVKWDKGEAVLYLLELLRRRESNFEEYGDSEEPPPPGAPATPKPPPVPVLDAEEDASLAPHEWYGSVLPVYVGDDVTDEDAFRALKPFGAVTVLVEPSAERAERPKATHATHTLKDVAAVREFVDALARKC